eukprot:TRINITY_DN11108_c0_g2_i1.p1 TRINITY_DN11108_c0_g2~~TRINITY_DN11108_c0_g2_i1.p1  ORF type:complete len:219 (-),score=64.39 TRINITY_DN11108_c0_g2_i1:60-647(-)
MTDGGFVPLSPKQIRTKDQKLHSRSMKERRSASGSYTSLPAILRIPEEKCTNEHEEVKFDTLRGVSKKGTTRISQRLTIPSVSLFQTDESCTGEEKAQHDGLEVSPLPQRAGEKKENLEMGTSKSRSTGEKRNRLSRSHLGNKVYYKTDNVDSNQLALPTTATTTTTTTTSLTPVNNGPMGQPAFPVSTLTALDS